MLKICNIENTNSPPFSPSLLCKEGEFSNIQCIMPLLYEVEKGPDNYRKGGDFMKNSKTHDMSSGFTIKCIFYT